MLPTCLNGRRDEMHATAAPPTANADRNTCSSMTSFLQLTRLLGLVVLPMITACADQTTAPEPAVVDVAPLFSAASAGIEGSYIVVLKEQANPRAVAALAGVTASHVYEHTLRGFAARLNPGQLNALQRLQAVDYIEQDQEYRADATQTLPSHGGLWGLDRIDQRLLPLSGTYTYSSPYILGTPVYAYVIDTGIWRHHSDFGGRAAPAYDVYGQDAGDCNGHGTHVAGTIGGSTYGVAKYVLLRSVRVLDCNGRGTTSGALAAIDWVRVHRQNPAVANLSFSGGFSEAMNTAVNGLARSGVFVVVAAGSLDMNACYASPASAANAFTAAASTQNDARVPNTNKGPCVDTYAPGWEVMSAARAGGWAMGGGSSTASAHVAGVAALYLARYGSASYATIASWLKDNATSGRITGNPSGTPNRLLYKADL